MAEFGYALAPAWRGQGLALEAARGLIDFAFADPAVQAHALPEENASARLLRRLGLQWREAIEDPDDRTVGRWALDRPSS